MFQHAPLRPCRRVHHPPLRNHQLQRTSSIQHQQVGTCPFLEGAHRVPTLEGIYGECVCRVGGEHGQNSLEGPLMGIVEGVYQVEEICWQCHLL